MRSLLTAGLALSLGLLVGAAQGQETTWRAVATGPPTSPAAAPSPAAASPSPVPIARSQPAAAPRSAVEPAAQLGRPVAIARSGGEGGVRPVNYSSQRDPGAIVVRGAAPD